MSHTSPSSLRPRTVDRSKVFLGSSNEGKDVAVRLADALDNSGLTESTVWTENVFRPGRHVLGSLVGVACEKVEYPTFRNFWVPDISLFASHPE